VDTLYLTQERTATASPTWLRLSLHCVLGCGGSLSVWALVAFCLCRFTSVVRGRAEPQVSTCFRRR
jgi:hypothetical protein